MDLYTLSPGFSKLQTIDVFDSLVWTERYNTPGDVTLVLPSSSPLAPYLQEGAFLHTPDSVEVMLIDTYSDEDGVLTVTGKTLTDFLRNRILRDTYKTIKTYWPIGSLSASAIANTIVTQMCIAGGLMGTTGTVLPGNAGLNELISNLSVGPVVAGTIQGIAVPYGNVYDGVKLAADADNLGFRMRPANFTDDLGGKIFETYRGVDRSSLQTVNPMVVFEPALDTLTGIKKLRSTAGWVTAAYSYAQGGTSIAQIGSAYASGTASVKDFGRRTLMVDASDVNVADYSDNGDLIAALNLRALEALLNNNYVRMLDGQIVPQNAYKYGRDYTLGDIIELRDATNVTQQTRITEYIRTQDTTGYHEYPTLSVSQS